MRHLLMLALLLLAPRVGLCAQGTAIIEGHITDDQRQPVSGVTVIVVGTAFSAQSDANGYYAMKDVPMGLVTLRTESAEFMPMELSDLRLPPGQRVVADFTVTPYPRPPAGSRLLLQFQLVEPFAGRTTDRTLLGMEPQLRGRERGMGEGYRPLAQSVVISDIPEAGPIQTGQALWAGGEQYQLTVIVDSVSGRRVRMQVFLEGWAATGDRNGRSTRITLLSTIITAAIGRPVVLGSVQRGGRGGGSMILVLTPALQLPRGSRGE